MFYLLIAILIFLAGCVLEYVGKRMTNSSRRMTHRTTGHAPGGFKDWVKNPERNRDS